LAQSNVGVLNFTGAGVDAIGAGAGAVEVKVSPLAAWPVGSIYLSMVATNPSSLFGGSWSLQSSGRMLVGWSLTDPDFSTVRGTGGAKTHTLAESEMPNHDHGPGSYGTNSAGGHKHNIDRSSATGSGGLVARGTSTSAVNNDSPVGSDGGHTHTVTGLSGARGGGGEHNNMPPYLVVYIWERTA
jgi:hypothetical protein